MLWWRGLIPDAGFAFVPKAMNAILCHAAVAENDGTVRRGLAVLSGDESSSYGCLDWGAPFCRYACLDGGKLGWGRAFNQNIP